MRRTSGVLLVVLMVLAPLSAPVAAADVVTLTVTVVDQDGNTVGGADLEASWSDGSASATTASNGKAFLDVEEGADVTIEVDHPDYVRNTPFEVDDASEEDVEVPVWQKGSMTITVQNNDTETLGGAQIAFTKDGLTQRVTATEDGVFESDPIEQGTYVVRVGHPTYFTERIEIDVDGDVSRTVTLERGSVKIGFRIVDDHFEEPKPVENVQITVRREGEQIGSVNTDANGEQGVSNVPVNARFQVTASKDGYRDVQETVSTSERTRQFNLTISRTPAINIEFPDRMVAGETAILAATNEYGEPVTGAAVFLDGEEVGQTDGEGEYRLGIETTGDHEVVVRDGELDSEPLVVTAVSGATATETTTATQTETATATATQTTTVTVTQTETATATETATQTETATATETSGGGVPGFTIGVAAIALAVAALVTRRR